MSIQSKFQLLRASESKIMTLKPFYIVLAPHFTEWLKQLCTATFTWLLLRWHLLSGHQPSERAYNQASGTRAAGLSRQ